MLTLLLSIFDPEVSGSLVTKLNLDSTVTTQPTKLPSQKYFRFELVRLSLIWKNLFIYLVCFSLQILLPRGILKISKIFRKTLVTEPFFLWSYRVNSCDFIKTGLFKGCFVSLYRTDYLWKAAFTLTQLKLLINTGVFVILPLKHFRFIVLWFYIWHCVYVLTLLQFRSKE